MSKIWNVFITKFFHYFYNMFVNNQFVNNINHAPFLSHTKAIVTIIEYHIHLCLLDLQISVKKYSGLHVKNIHSASFQL
jgi:hypothetical protein